MILDKDLLDLSDLKKGDVIDIMGVFTDIPLAVGENIGVIVLSNLKEEVQLR